jgi:hypothetical protein
MPPCPFVMGRPERPDDLIFGTSALRTRGGTRLPRILRISGAPYDLHVAVSRAQTSFCRVGLVRSGLELWP